MARDPKPPEGELVVPVDDEPKPPGVEPAGDDPSALADLTVPELEEEAALRGIRIGEGSGKDGAVVKADLIDAIEKADAPPPGRPPLIQVAQSAVVIPTPVED
jgi:hypothetical protein